MDDKKHKYDGYNKYIESGDFDNQVKELVQSIIDDYIPQDPRSTPVETPETRDDEPLTIAEAKQRLARSLGVDISNIRIIIEA